MIRTPNTADTKSRTLSTFIPSARSLPANSFIGDIIGDLLILETFEFRQNQQIRNVATLPGINFLQRLRNGFHDSYFGRLREIQQSVCGYEYPLMNTREDCISANRLGGRACAGLRDLLRQG